MTWGIALMNLNVQPIYNVFPDPPDPCTIEEDKPVKKVMPVSERVRLASMVSAQKRQKRRMQLCLKIYYWIVLGRPKDVRDIAQHFDISIPYAREFTTMLENEGKIESFIGKGRWVKFRRKVCQS